MLPMIKATYRARACGAASFSPSSKGNQQIAIPMEVAAGEFEGHNITWIATFHDTPDRNGVTGSDRILESLVFMGWQGDDLTELVDIDDARARELMPDSVDIVCEPDTYDGKTNLKVKWVNKPGAGRFAFKEPVAKNDLKAFASQMRGAIRNARGASGGARPANGSQPSQPSSPGGRDRDDIPF